MLGEIRVENVVIFVSDSLRWDYLPDEIRELGVTFKSIASSLFTASSFPSIVSGLYPNQHKVLSFHHEFPDNAANILKLPGYNTSFWTGNTWVKYEPRESAPIFKNIGHSKRISLEELKPPFIYIEDDKGGHSPYGYSFHDYDSYSDFYKEHLDAGLLRAKYKQGIELSAKNFHERMEVLKSRKLLDDTLVIFTSDHGELLGEYGGLMGHAYPACPELVFVPTCFIHPGLKRSVPEDGIIRHVDIAPTVMSALGREIPHSMQGVDLTKAKALPKTGYNYASVLGGSYEVSSVWDGDGGHVFYRLPFRKRSLFALKGVLRGVNCIVFRSKFKRILNFLSAIKDGIELIRHLGSHYMKYLNPQFSAEEARIIVEKLESRIALNENVAVSSEETKRKLRDLGYMD